MDQYFFFRKSLWRLSLKNPAPEKKLRIHGKVSQVSLLLKSMELFRRFCCRPLSVFLFCSRYTDVFVMDNTFTLFHSPQFYKSFVIRIYANDHNTFLFLLRLLYFDNKEWTCTCPNDVTRILTGFKENQEQTNKESTGWNEEKIKKLLQ